MDIQRSYTGIGAHKDEGFLTFLVYPDIRANSFEVYREKGNSTILKYDKEDQVLNIQLSGEKCAHILKISINHKPGKIVLDDKVLMEGIDFEYDSNYKKLNIRTTFYETGIYQIHL